MHESQRLEVDNLAAKALLGSLGLEATPEHLNLAAAQLAEHRNSYVSWLLGRAHSKIVEILETRFRECLDRKSEDWVAGYQFAEQEVARLMPEDLAGLVQDRPRSKGQILRSMVREARRQTEIISRRGA